MEMSPLVWTYLAYAAISIAVTMWVGHILKVKGKLLLGRKYGGDDELADSLSDLTAVGFYLLHIGFAMIFLRYGERATDLVDGIEVLSTKIGVVLCVLAISHVIHVIVFSSPGRSGRTVDAELVEAG
jgi:hypothetical protein